MPLFVPLVGMLVTPADGSRYQGRVIYVSEEEDTVKHQCLKTGQIYEKSYFGFQVRYNPVEDKMGWWKGKEVYIKAPRARLTYWVGAKKAQDRIGVEVMGQNDMSLTVPETRALSRALEKLVHWSKTAAGEKAIRKERMKHKDHQPVNTQGTT